MTEITLVFPVGSAPDPAVVKALQERCAQLEHVESATVPADRAFGVDDVILILAVSGKLFAAGAASLVALKQLIDAAKGVGQSLGLDKLLVESRGDFVEPAHLTPADAQALAPSPP